MIVQNIVIKPTISLKIDFLFSLYHSKLTSAFGQFIMSPVCEIIPLEVACEATEVRVDRKGGEFMLVVTQDRTVDHQAHELTHKSSTLWRLKHRTTCIVTTKCRRQKE